ncbi:MAG: type II toxin-antitoxin system RelE/ParE family toxin [Acidithiobacillus caldus]|uniref:Uncharacterized protein n=1 Tax=Acidithiobacillus caldus TaxID=33059 RepID=A0A1E7YQG3_9PROT|nr:type II toxin-antitoxin system RelE/ParE family toxin [Acidithiobacillus caldus]OFC35254.1 hypothetical protein BAE29_16100 [Acidithiobacillus caldus]OFC38573.1 hypothetical protein BAE27_01890 [Acidithiobacillus caldus]OFC39731.1 hypothetical protein BAE28_02635 [Acidithiobacillus caldus]WMT47173.1 MAG: type II toxin-antitoxin system RelE/ParE family toxin [Acidithiobacillus caldus]
MLPIVWRASASDDLATIIRYIANESPQAARRMKHLLEGAVLPVAEHPYLYRQSERIPGLREIVAHPNYIVLYRVTATCVEIVSVVHARREFPNRTPGEQSNRNV